MLNLLLLPHLPPEHSILMKATLQATSEDEEEDDDNDEYESDRLMEYYTAFKIQYRSESG